MVVGTEVTLAPATQDDPYGSEVARAGQLDRVLGVEALRLERELLLGVGERAAVLAVRVRAAFVDQRQHVASLRRQGGHVDPGQTCLRVDRGVGRGGRTSVGAGVDRRLRTGTALLVPRPGDHGKEHRHHQHKVEQGPRRPPPHHEVGSERLRNPAARGAVESTLNAKSCRAGSSFHACRSADDTRPTATMSASPVTTIPARRAPAAITSPNRSGAIPPTANHGVPFGSPTGIASAAIRTSPVPGAVAVPDARCTGPTRAKSTASLSATRWQPSASNAGAPTSAYSWRRA